MQLLTYCYLPTTLLLLLLLYLYFMLPTRNRFSALSEPSSMSSLGKITKKRLASESRSNSPPLKASNTAHSSAESIANSEEMLLPDTAEEKMLLPPPAEDEMQLQETAEDSTEGNFRQINGPRTSSQVSLPDNIHRTVFITGVTSNVTKLPAKQASQLRKDLFSKAGEVDNLIYSGSSIKVICRK